MNFEIMLKMSFAKRRMEFEDVKYYQQDLLCDEKNGILTISQKKNIQIDKLYKISWKIMHTIEFITFV